MTRLLDTLELVDHDGATLTVELYDDNRPVLRCDPTGVEFDRDQVADLRDYLSAWLAEQGVHAQPPTCCTGEDDSPCCPTESPATILEDAQAMVYGDREGDYGHPREDFTRTAVLWTGLLQHKLADGAYIEAEDIARCQIGVKLARDVHAPKRDNRVDMAGYALTLDRLETGR